MSVGDPKVVKFHLMMAASIPFMYISEMLQYWFFRNGAGLYKL